MLWLTSLFFIPSILKAFQRKKRFATGMFSVLSMTSLLHHSSLGDDRVLMIDKTMAHVAAVWGFLQGFRHRLWQLLPFGSWAPIAYYGIEAHVPQPWKDIVHATIHISSGWIFCQIIEVC